MHYNSGPRQSAPVRHPMSEPYNAASDLLDRNIAAARADTRGRFAFGSERVLAAIEPASAKLKDLEVIVVGGAKDELAGALAREADRFDTVATHPDEPAFWLYSSGSTGMPKGTKHVQTSMMATAKLFAQQTLGMREDDVVYSAAKLFFAYRLGHSP